MTFTAETRKFHEYIHKPSFALECEQDNDVYLAYI